MDFGSLNRVIFHTVDSLHTLAKEVKTDPKKDLKEITKELYDTNEILEETIEDIDQKAISDAAKKALTGLRKNLRDEVMRSISSQLLTNIPLLQVQAGTAQTQQTLFFRELKKFEERLQYVLNGLKKSRGGQAAEVEQDTTE
jgi:hypothetical protein